jgi:hypothetical protein
VICHDILVAHGHKRLVPMTATSKHCQAGRNHCLFQSKE